MITNPPPYESAPTLNATQTSAATPPTVAVAATAPSGQRWLSSFGSLRRIPASTTSTTPHASSTRTSQGPTVAAAVPPSSA
jgi:hypothetical protein